jgi:transposase-like protein
LLTLKQARKLFKEYGTLKYRGSKQIVLGTLIDATYRGSANAEADITGRAFIIRASSLRRKSGVEDQQLMRLLKGIEEVKLEGREDGEITFRLDLRLLENAEYLKQAQKQLDRARTEKARQKKAAQRAAKREPDYSKMNAIEIVQHGIKLFERTGV